ncbi:S8 family peptidase [Streptomyces sp. NPDC097617]|uniref:S8 family peptidase n=1 Tax=Streptomyces sp. NPDC097617 TaxID=3366091 RepID=UPI003812EFC9
MANDSPSTLPVLLTVPIAGPPTVGVLEQRTREIGGNVIRILALAAAVAAEVTLPQLVLLLEEFPHVRAGLDEPGDLEGDPVNEDKEYLQEELDWSADEVAKVTGGLARLIAESDMAGLEGVGLPIVIHLPSSSDPFVDGRVADFPDRLAFLDSIKASNASVVGAVEAIMRARDLNIGQRLVLTGAVTSNMTEEQIRGLLQSGENEISLVELDTPGVLELDIAGPAIELPLIDPNMGLDGAGQIVAVLDGEIASHPAVNGRVTQKSAFSKFDWGENPEHAAETFSQSHATAVATIIAGDGSGENGPSGRIGVAPRAQIWNYKIAPATKRGSDVAVALEKAFLDGVRIINLSWGAKDAEIDGNSVWSRTADALFAQGVLVCKSAGNDGPGAGTLTAPGDAARALVVGATNREGTALHTGSSRGPTADGRAKPDVVAPGGGTVAGSPPDAYEPTTVPGTSFAAPFGAGLAALLWQHSPDATVSQIRDAIVASCHELPGLGPSDQGAGLISVVRAVNALNQA